MSTSPHDPGSAASRGTALLEPLREEGRQLDSAARADLQSSLGASFGDVVVHTGSASAAAAERADAAAFTVGRHVVFGAGAYDPGSTRGRMLLAHELAHVIQQRRGGGDPDLGESLPGSALGRHTPGVGEASAGVTAAQAALGMSASVSGAAPVGVARQDKEEEKGWREVLWDKAKEKIRDKAKESLGFVEGVAIEAGQIVDTVSWVESKTVDAVDGAVDYVGKAAGASQETLDSIKSYNAGDYKKARAEAKKLGMVDPDTGAPIVSGKITEGFDSAESFLDSKVFTGMKKEEGFFSTREIGQLEGAIGTQVALSFVGVEEVQIALKLVSGVGVFKSIVDAMDKNPRGFLSDRRFWTAVANGLLHVAGLKAASSGRKIVTLVVDVLSVTLSSTTEILQLRDDFLKPPGPERDKAIAKDIQSLIKVLAGAVQQALTHHKSLKAAGAKGDTVEAPATASRKADGDLSAAPETAPAAKGSIAGGNAEMPAIPAAKPPKGTAPDTATSPTANPRKAVNRSPENASEAKVPSQTASDPPTGKGGKTDKAGKTGPESKGSADTGTPKTASVSLEPVAETQVKGGKKTDTVSATKRKAEAGKRMEGRAAKDQTKATAAAALAAGKVDAAKTRLATAKAKRAEEPPGASTKRKLSNGEKEVRAADRALKSAEKGTLKAATAEKKAADKVIETKKLAGDRAEAHEAAKKADAERKAAAKLQQDENEKPRYTPDQAYDPKKYRRPDLDSFDVTGHPVDRLGADSLTTDRQARVSVFHDPLGKKVAPVQGATPQERGHDFERALRDDLTKGSKYRVSHAAGDKTRHGDVGSYETKYKKRLSSEDLDQLWRDLNNPQTGNGALIITPKLHPTDAKALAKLAAIFEEVTGKRPNIAVRETDRPAGFGKSP